MGEEGYPHYLQKPNGVEPHLFDIIPAIHHLQTLFLHPSIRSSINLERYRNLNEVLDYLSNYFNSLTQALVGDGLFQVPHKPPPGVPALIPQLTELYFPLRELMQEDLATDPGYIPPIRQLPEAHNGNLTEWDKRCCQRSYLMVVCDYHPFKVVPQQDRALHQERQHQQDRALHQDRQQQQQDWVPPPEIDYNDVTTPNMYKNQFIHRQDQFIHHISEQPEFHQDRPHDNTYGIVDQDEEYHRIQQDREQENRDADLENLNNDINQIAGMDISALDFNYEEYLPQERRTPGVGQEADTDQPKENQPMEGLQPIDYRVGVRNIET